MSIPLVGAKVRSASGVVGVVQVVYDVEDVIAPMARREADAFCKRCAASLGPSWRELFYQADVAWENGTSGLCDGRQLTIIEERMVRPSGYSKL